MKPIVPSTVGAVVLGVGLALAAGQAPKAPARRQSLPLSRSGHTARDSAGRRGHVGEARGAATRGRAYRWP